MCGNSPNINTPSLKTLLVLKQLNIKSKRFTKLKHHTISFQLMNMVMNLLDTNY